MEIHAKVSIPNTAFDTPEVECRIKTASISTGTFLYRLMVINGIIHTEKRKKELNG